MPRPFDVPHVLLTRSGVRTRPAASRPAAPRPAAPRPAFLVVGLIFALIAGILAMHTMATSMGDHLQGEASMSMRQTQPMTGQSEAQFAHDSAPTPVFTGVTPSWVANDENPMGHAMTLMVCILALLFAALATATTTAEGRIAGRRVWAVSGRRSVAVRETRTARAPPDLNQLSLSRV